MNRYDLNTVASAIPKGAGNAIPRKALAERLDVSDRTMRRWLEMARKDGLSVINLQDGGGYYLAEDDDIETRAKRYFQEYARALTILSGLKSERRFLKSRGVKVTFDKETDETRAGEYYFNIFDMPIGGAP